MTQEEFGKRFYKQHPERRVPHPDLWKTADAYNAGKQGTPLEHRFFSNDAQLCTGFMELMATFNYRGIETLQQSEKIRGYPLGKIVYASVPRLVKPPLVEVNAYLCEDLKLRAASDNGVIRNMPYFITGDGQAVWEGIQLQGSRMVKNPDRAFPGHWEFQGEIHASASDHSRDKSVYVKPSSIPGGYTQHVVEISLEERLFDLAKQHTHRY